MSSVRKLVPVLVLVVAVLPAAGRAEGRAQPHCGDTVTADVTLTADLDCSAAYTDALRIGATHVTIDLGGHTILGGGGGRGFDGIYVGGFDHVTITNGTIENFTNGVFVDGESAPADHTAISDLTVWLDGDYGGCTYDLYGVWLYESDFSGVENVTVNNRGPDHGTGVFCRSFGIYGAEGWRDVYVDNIVNDIEYSYYDADSSHDTWRGNVSNGVPGGTFAFCDDDGTNLYEDNLALDGLRGFKFDSTSPCCTVVARNNVSRGNTGPGFVIEGEFRGTQGSRLEGNQAIDNGGDGFADNGSSRAVWTGNAATGNLNGFSASGGSRRTWTDNSAFGNTDEGFLFLHWDHDRATRNIATGNRSGFVLSNTVVGTSGKFSNNTADDNTYWGHFAGDFDLPGHGNGGQGNGTANCNTHVNGGLGCP